MPTLIFSPPAERLRHVQAPRLPLRAAQPSGPLLQRASQDGDAETQNPEPLHHHHPNLLSGERVVLVLFIVFAAVRSPAFSFVCLCSCLACRTWCFSPRTARPSTPATPHRTTLRTACSCCRRRDEQHTEWMDRQTDRPTHTHTNTQHSAVTCRTLPATHLAALLMLVVMCGCIPSPQCRTFPQEIC